MVRTAYKDRPDFTFAPVDGLLEDDLELPFPDATFDVVVMHDHLQWLETDGVASRLREARRVLIPEGRLFATAYLLDESARASIADGTADRVGLDRDWRLRGASLVRGNDELRAKAVAVAAPVPIDVSPAVFDRLVGTYDVGPGTKVAVKREGDRLMAVQEQQPPVELIPESETSYFILVQNLRVVFETDASGRATGLVIKLPGQEVKGKKTD